MFTDNELKATKDFADRKINDLLNSEEGTDADYIKNLQTLIKLREAANKRLESDR